jgi:hypothetical protein
MPRSPSILPTDRETYTEPDSGCFEATKFLGRASKCSECPFEECVLVKPLAKQQREKRDAKILDLYWQGTDIAKLMKMFRLTQRGVMRIVYREAGRRKK